MNSQALKRSMWQIPSILALACVMAFGVNAWRPEGIPLFGDWSPEARYTDGSGETLVIEIDEAGRMFENGEAVFVDARPEGLYAEGHIQGALNIPLQDADRRFAEVMGKLDPLKTIITYCDGETCELSHEVALFFKQFGFEKVRVLVNGWTRWKTAGLPTAGGE